MQMKFELVSTQNEAAGTKTFFFKPQTKLNFEPGQYIYYTLNNLEKEDPRGPVRHFTIASSPTEENLMLTTRIRPESAYKQALNVLPIGSIVEAEGPQGFFNFEQIEGRTNVYLAGGIGITPFRSMIKYSIDKKINVPTHLIYSNSGQDFIFKDELTAWEENSPILKISFVDTLLSGHIDKSMLSNILQNSGTDKDNSVFWIVGPPAFVSAIEGVVESMDVSEDYIKSEKFTGY